MLVQFVIVDARFAMTGTGDTGLARTFTGVAFSHDNRINGIRNFFSEGISLSTLSAIGITQTGLTL